MKAPLIMGVLNVTPDSFSDSGLYSQVDSALRYGITMLNQGADIIDIGGESSRPNAKSVSVDEELDRVIPVVEKLYQETNAKISVDTTKLEVMKESYKAGAYMINDINALQAPGALEFVAKSKMEACLMHMQNKPENMQDNPTYTNVVDEVYDFFVNRIKQCQKAGIDKNRLIIDPGIGFGKTFLHNVLLLKKLSYFKKLSLPILVGLSKKSFLDTILGGETITSDRVTASVSAAVVSFCQGANIVRVHDVQQTKEALMVAYALSQDSPILL